MSNYSDGNNQIDWEDVILRLEAFTRSFAKGKPWFRGGDTTTFLMGKEIKDYVFEAIGKYLEKPEKYDPAKGDFLSYLKYNLIRSLVSNDLAKNENKETEDVFINPFENDESDEDSSYLDSILPFTEALFTDDIDFALIKQFIENNIQGDEQVENIFLSIYSYGMKRREVIEEFNMTESDYDNGMRRLKTILSRTSLHFNPNQQTV